jgi:calcineurin-like phosphoesterase family protein
MVVCVDITNYFFTSDFNFGIAAIASSRLTFPRYNTIGKVLLLNIEETLNITPSSLFYGQLNKGNNKITEIRNWFF